MDLSTLLIRVLHDVLEENDTERRRAAGRRTAAVNPLFDKVL